MKTKHALILVAMSAMTVFNFAVPDADSFRTPELARFIFWHLPCAFLSLWFLFHDAFLGLKYLKTRDLRWDVRQGAAVELGTLFATLTMVTGILFSKAQWGTWWNWDPRQTSFLMVLFLFALGQALRGGFEDEQRRASVSSAYSLLTLLPSLFLILVFPRLKQVQQASFHPTQTIAQGQLIGPYAVGVWGTFLVLCLIAAELYRQRVKAGHLSLEMEAAYGSDPVRSGRATPTGVVRPVGVHEKD